MIAVTIAVLLSLFAFFRFTPLGLAMRAAAQNPASARLAGISVDWMLALGWGLAAAIGAVAGTMVAPAVYLEPNMMASILLYGFAGALVGGISSPGGAVAGGFIVGVLENLIAYLGNVIERTTGVYIVGNGEKLTVALVIVIAVLTLKPNGLFGRVTVQRV
jgi:branched-chain amino acid transport system permease protein